MASTMTDSTMVNPVTKIERSFDWIVEDIGKDLHINGVEYTRDVYAYLQRKLLVFNGAHAILGWLGYNRGIESPALAMQDEQIREIVEGALKEAANAISVEYKINSDKMENYIQTISDRFQNKFIPDKTERLAKDPLRKLSERVIAATLLAQKNGLPTNYLRQGIEAGLEYNNPSDKESVELQTLLKQKNSDGVMKEYFGLCLKE